MSRSAGRWGGTVHVFAHPSPGRPSAFAKPWDPKAPLATPSGLADPAAAVEVLVKMAGQMKSVFESIDVPFADAARMRRGSFDFPAQGGPGVLGFFRAIDYSFSKRDKKFLANGGDSYVCAVEFSSPVRAFMWPAVRLPQLNQCIFAPARPCAMSC